MCLAIPLRLIEINGSTGIGEQAGMRREIGLDLIENPKIGDYLLVHAGFAIERIDEEEAAETLELFRQLAEVSFPPSVSEPEK